MDIMMLLGPFPFMIKTVAYDTLNRTFNYEWASQQRLPHTKYKYFGIGGPALQYMGPGEQTIDLDGVIYPGQQGMSVSLALLRTMAASGKPLLMMNNTGGIMGRWIIKTINETNSVYTKLKKKVSPRKIEFSLSLQRYIDYDVDAALLLMGGGQL